MTWPPGRQSWSEAQPWTPSPHSDPGTRWGLLCYMWGMFYREFIAEFFTLLFEILSLREGPLELLLMSVPPPVSSQEKQFICTALWIIRGTTNHLPATPRCPLWLPWTALTTPLTPSTPLDDRFDPLGRPGTPYMSTMTLWQGSLLLILRGGCLPFKNSNFQQIYKKLNQFYKKLRSDKVGSNPTLPKGQKPKWHLTTNCHTDKKW